MQAFQALKQGSFFQKVYMFCSASFPLLFLIRNFNIFKNYDYFEFFPMISTTVLKTLSEKVRLNFGYEKWEENAEGDTIVLVVMSSL